MLSNFPKITFICWKWQPENKKDKHFRRLKQFTSKHVNILYSMLKRNYQDPFRLVCITDDPSELNDGIETFELWNDFRDLGGCYTRLKIFDAYTNLQIARGADYIISIDLDMVIADDITEFINEKRNGNPFITWYRPGENNPHCGALWMLKPGFCYSLWSNLSEKKIKELKSQKVRNGKNLMLSQGTDQTWINSKIDSIKTTSENNIFGDGIYDYKRLESPESLPSGAKMVFFNGRRLMPENFMYLSWVKGNYHE